MKNLILLFWVMGLQYIACRLSEWSVPETLFTLAIVFFWQTLFLCIFHKIRINHKLGEYHYNIAIWYVLMPIVSLFAPLITLIFMICGTLVELRKISGCISLSNWMKSQIVIDGRIKDDLESETVEFADEIYYNPATGYPMSGGIDSAGYSFGSCDHDYYYGK
ncbi:hypothetical protein OOL41_004670 [Salmonella enterica]|nr:hypothetical protein [Salmonella enterica]